MLDHDDQTISLVIDRGEEEMKSWVWMRSGRSKSSTQTFYSWHTRYPWRKSRTFLRPCSTRWLVYHGHGFDYFDGYLELWCVTMIRTPILLHRLRDLRVIHFCTTVYYILVAWKPHFCIMTLMYYDVTFWMFNEFFLWWSILFIYMCVKMYVCDMLMVYETNANLTHS